MISLLFELTALVGASVHAEPGAGEPREATVLVSDGRIVEVAPGRVVPPAAEVVDLAGLHLLPGLIDAFAYADPDHELLYVAAGVLAIRDHGNDLGRVFSVRAAAPERLAPALATAGAVLDGLPPATAEAVVLTTVDEVDANLPTLLAAEPDFLAVHRNLAPEPWRRVLALAAEHELDVWGPRPRAVGVDEFLASAQRGHIGLEDLFLAGGADWDTFEGAGAAPRVAALAAAGMAVVPLQGVLARFGESGEPAGSKARALRWLGPQYRARWSAERAAREAAEAADDTLLEREGVLLERRGELLARLAAAGVPLVAGSGAPNPWLPPGAALHDELAAWRRAGVPAATCLRAATAESARILGVAAERGTIAAGRVADLIAVSADPREDLDVLRRPDVIVLRGRVLRRAELDQALEELAAAQDAAAQPRAIDARPPKLPAGDVLLRGTATTSAVGARLSVESWAVVRDPTGFLVFVGPRGPARRERTRRRRDLRATALPGQAAEGLPRPLARPGPRDRGARPVLGRQPAHRAARRRPLHRQPHDQRARRGPRHRQRDDADPAGPRAGRR